MASESPVPLSFALPSAPPVPEDNTYKYKILVADDDNDVHTVTKLVLGDFLFENSPLELIDTYSAKETIEVLKNNNDIAVILLDVVMETDTAGLDVVEFTRKVLKNDLTRIILKTGQPGIAPEEKVIIEYDINDYKSKAELTAQRFITSLYTALRNYRDLRKLSDHKKGFQQVIESSSGFYRHDNLKDFFKGLLDQLTSLCRFHNNIEESRDGFIAFKAEGDFKIISASGRYSPLEGKALDAMDEAGRLRAFINEAGNQSYFTKKEKERFLCYYKGFQNAENLICLDGDLNELNQEMVLLFLNNFTFAFDRLFMNREMMSGLQQIVSMLGELIEYRDGETGFHVRRVSETVKLLASVSGMNASECEDLSIASMVHDIGKIAIDDAILKKPGKLTEEEFEEIKKHTSMGHAILKGSNIPSVKLAAGIALSHHEKWAGGGYPQGLSGEEIPWGARLTAIVDVFDALANKRYYKDAWPEEKIREVLNEEKGRSFDPAIVDLFMENWKGIMEIQKLYPDA